MASSSSGSGGPPAWQGPAPLAMDIGAGWSKFGFAYPGTDGPAHVLPTCIANNAHYAGRLNSNSVMSIRYAAS